MGRAPRPGLGFLDPISPTEDPLTFCISDKKRSAFGLGWEHHRRGLSIEHNPFPAESRQHQQYVDGWLEFQPSQTASYGAATNLAEADTV